MAFFQAIACNSFILVFKKVDHMMTNISWPQFAAQLLQIPQ